MRIGLQIPSFTFPTPINTTLKSIVQTAEEGGFYSLWVMDHFFQISMIGSPEMEMLEGYSTLSYFAGLTSRVKLGTLVTGAIYRYPGILVKTMTTLDVLSGGRAYLGIGAGWFEQEAKGLGVPFPPLKERFERLEETLQIAHQMWSGKVAPYQGIHFHLEETLTSPMPISKPHPPIMIGGGGEQKTLRLVAQYADACNLFLRMGESELKHKLDILKQHCEEVGRPYDAIEKTALGTITPDLTGSAIIEQCRAAAAVGLQHIIFNIVNLHDLQGLNLLIKEVIPAVADF